jgi:hypothetical protein
MADPLLMAMWPPRPNDENCYEFVLPETAIYSLTQVDGMTVNTTDATGKLVPTENVQWYLDYSRREGTSSTTKRYVTTRKLSPQKAKEWALEVVEEDEDE